MLNQGLQSMPAFQEDPRGLPRRVGVKVDEVELERLPVEAPPDVDADDRVL